MRLLVYQNSPSSLIGITFLQARPGFALRRTLVMGNPGEFWGMGCCWGYLDVKEREPSRKRVSIGHGGAARKVSVARNIWRSIVNFALIFQAKIFLRSRILHD
jgi:hypothetical protein